MIFWKIQQTKRGSVDPVKYFVRYNIFLRYCYPVEIPHIYTIWTFEIIWYCDPGKVYPKIYQQSNQSKDINISYSFSFLKSRMGASLLSSHLLWKFLIKWEAEALISRNITRVMGAHTYIIVTITLTLLSDLYLHLNSLLLQLHWHLNLLKLNTYIIVTLIFVLKFIFVTITLSLTLT